MYEFEKYLAKNALDMPVINARRFAAAIRRAMGHLQNEAGCYKLNNEPYCVEINAYLEQMATRLEATPSNFKKEVIKKTPLFWEKFAEEDEDWPLEWYRCPTCKSSADEQPCTGKPWFRNYCPECGQKLLTTSEALEFDPFKNFDK